MRRLARHNRHVDWERVGFMTMREAHDEALAMEICGLRLNAFDDELKPEVLIVESKINETRLRAEALHSQLYGCHEPVSDIAILGQKIETSILTILLAAVFAASVIAHAATFSFLFGWSTIVSSIIGLILACLVTVPGYLAFEYVTQHPILRACIVVTSVVLCLAGLIELSETRGYAVHRTASANDTTSFVDGTDSVEAPVDEPTDQTIANRVQRLVTNAAICIFLACDLMVGLLLGMVTAIRTNSMFAGWHHLKELKEIAHKLQAKRAQLLAKGEIAKKRCRAGIVRAKQSERGNQIPYFRLASLLLIGLLGFAHTALGQPEIRRDEYAVIDASGSVATKAQTGELFREYLAGLKRLLQTEPPSSRVSVMLVSSDSFGTRSLVTGWTPPGAGVFTDDLDRARQQLVRALAAKTDGLAPSAAATDLFGALSKVKALAESHDMSRTNRPARELFLFTDAIQETRQFDMPALVPFGAVKMLEMARQRQLVVPLPGFRVHIYGVSTIGSSPLIWNTVRSFWQQYFQAAGATLVSYSPETSVDRH